MHSVNCDSYSNHYNQCPNLHSLIYLLGEADPCHSTQYAQDECYDYNDDIDQLFDLSYELIRLSRSRARKSKKVIERNAIHNTSYVSYH